MNELYKALRMVYSWYTKKRIIYYYKQGHRAPSIARLLLEEDIAASRVGIAKLIGRYKQSGTIVRCPGSGRPTVITPEIKTIVEEKMRSDDETTAEQLHVLLTSHGFRISRKTILRCRADLGWTFRGSAYCQLIRESNRAKRLQWARDHTRDAFENVIWTDECSVQLETHKRFCCRKQGEAPRPKPR